MNVTYNVKVLKLGALRQASVLRIGYVMHGEAADQHEEDVGLDEFNPCDSAESTDSELNSAEFNPGELNPGASAESSGVFGELNSGGNAADEVLDQPWDGFDFDDSEGIRE